MNVDARAFQVDVPCQVDVVDAACAKLGGLPGADERSQEKAA